MSGFTPFFFACALRVNLHLKCMKLKTLGTRLFSASFIYITALLTCISQAQANSPNIPKNSSWADLEKDSSYTLSRDLNITSGFKLPKGTNLQYTDVLTLDPTPVLALSFRVSPCTSNLNQGPFSLAMIDNTYGLDYAKNCQVTIYLEWRDYYNESFFESK